MIQLQVFKPNISRHTDTQAQSGKCQNAVQIKQNYRLHDDWQMKFKLAQRTKWFLMVLYDLSAFGICLLKFTHFILWALDERMQNKAI